MNPDIVDYNWDHRITYFLIGDDGQHFRFVIYMKDRNTERITMGFTESVVDTIISKARERWNELIKEGWILKKIDTARNSPAMAKQAKDNMLKHLDVHPDYISEYALDA